MGALLLSLPCLLLVGASVQGWQPGGPPQIAVVLAALGFLGMRLWLVPG